MGALSKNFSIREREPLWRTERFIPQAHLRKFFEFVLFITAFYFAYRYGMSFSHTSAAPFWFPDSILLCALLKVRPRWWWLPLLATLPIRLTVTVPPDTPLWFLISVYANDCLKAVLGSLLLRRFLVNPTQFRTLREFALYCLSVVLLTPILSAFAGAAARYGLGDNYWAAWERWFLGNAATAFVFTPAVFYWVLRPLGIGQISTARRVEAALLVLGFAISSWVALAPTTAAVPTAETRLYISLVFLIWAAVRFGMRGATAAMVLLTFFAVDAALSAHRSAGQSPSEVAAELQQLLLLRAAPLYLIAVLIDQMRQAEQSLRESEQRYRDVMDNQNHLVCRFLPDTTLTFVNQAYCRFIARPRSELLGVRLLSLVPESVRAVVADQIAIAGVAREPAECTYETPTETGGSVWHQWIYHAIYDAQGAVSEFQAIAHDITDHKRLEEANQHLTHAARLATVGELTAMVAHEISQPLAAILSNAETAQTLLRSQQPPLADLQEIVADILKSDLRATEIVRSVRALANKRELQLCPMDLNEMVAKVLRLVAGDALRRGVSIRTQLVAELPLVNGDTGSLEQVLLNLIVNGMDAMGEAPVSERLLRVETRCVDRETVEVVIADNGHGISADKMPHLFDSFYTTKHDGMGLGLSIARSIVQAHEGRIWAESPNGGGAVFYFTLHTAKNSSELEVAK